MKHTPCVMRVVPARAEERSIGNTSSLMHALVLSEKFPTALELAGTRHERSLLVRSRSEAAQRHLLTQLRARAPQLACSTLAREEDPLWRREGETLSVTELHLGAAVYAPLHPFSERELREKGADPLLGLLAALDDLPEGIRAVAQLALVPASPGWSRRYQRLGLQDALEPERERQRMASARISWPFILVGLLVAFGLMTYQQHRLPAPLAGGITQVLQGHLAALPLLQQMLFLLVLLAPLGLLLLLRRLGAWLFAPPLYDRRQVSQQTIQMAYQVRLRLYAFGPDPLWHERRARKRAWHWPSWLKGGVHWRPSLTRWGEGVREIWQQGVRWSAEVGQRARHWWALPLNTRLERTRSILWQASTNSARALWGGCRRLARSSYRRLRGQVEHYRAGRQGQQSREEVLARLIAAYRQYHLTAAGGNYFVPHRLTTGRAHRLLSEHWLVRLCAGGWWQGLTHAPGVLSAETVGLLWHLPQAMDLPELAQVEHRLSRTLLVPPSLAQIPKGAQVLGISEHAGHRLPFALPAECLDRHLLLVGKSGEGKSSAFSHLALTAMQQEGTGLVVLDPHGDLVDQLLGLVPAHRQEEVVLVDLSETRFAVGLNPIDVTLERGREKAITDLLSTLSHIWVSSWGSRMEASFFYALRTLYEANRHLVCTKGAQGIAEQYTLLDVVPVLTEESFRHALLEQIPDPFIRRWWRSYYDPLSLYMQRDRSDPVLSKIARFESPLARRIVGQSHSTLDLSDCIAHHRLLFVKLAKGVVGEDVAGLLGALLVGLLQFAFAEQGALSLQERHHLPVLIDEFQVLKGVDWSLLAEIRKYGASFFLATQSLDYLRETNQQILPTVLANITQLLSFHTSAQDARTLAPELGVEQEDLLALSSHQCYLKLTAQGLRQPTFSLTIAPPPQGDRTGAEQIRQRCRHTQMRPVVLVEEAISEALIRAEAMRARARQSANYRGRKNRDQHLSLPSDASGEQRTQGAGSSASEETANPAPMHWGETTGYPAEPADDEETGREQAREEIDPGE